MKTVYYAHGLYLYDTPQEQRDVDTLEALGFAVLNPNCPAVQTIVRKFKAEHGESADVMPVFLPLVKQCDALAFRSFPEGRIPSGVAKEIEYALEAKRVVIELPSCINLRMLNHHQTRQYLHDIGQR